MPIYEYQCSKCDHRLEALQKISDAPLTECPACHEQSLQKLISAASFRLKGGGWYETDFKTQGRKQLAESDSAEGGKGKSEGKADSGKDEKNKSASSSSQDKKADSKSDSSKASSDSKSQAPARDS